MTRLELHVEGKDLPVAMMASTFDSFLRYGESHGLFTYKMQTKVIVADAAPATPIDEDDDIVEVVETTDKYVVRERRSEMTEDEIAEAVRLYTVEHMTISKIAKRMHRSSFTINSKLMDAGVQFTAEQNFRVIK